MKICRYCGTENGDDAVVCSLCAAKDFVCRCEACGTSLEDMSVCPECGMEAGAQKGSCPPGVELPALEACRNGNADLEALPDGEGAGSAKRRKTRRTWVWVLGWLALFPLPLTMLAMRGKHRKHPGRLGLCAAAWLLYGLLAVGGIRSAAAAGPLPQLAASAAALPAEDCQTQVPQPVEAALQQAGQAAETALPTPLPVEIECISAVPDANRLCVGEYVLTTVQITPENAGERALQWSTSDPYVAMVSGGGDITAIGPGSAVIRAEAGNGVQASFGISVEEGTKRMRVETRQTRLDDNNIGKEWSYVIELNGETIPDTMLLAAGDALSFYARFTEADSKPDVGEASAVRTVTQEALQSGFEVMLELVVTENGGRNRNKAARFELIYSFSPVP